MHTPPIRVLVVDDHAVVRSSLRFFLAGADDIKIVGEGSSGAEALELVARLVPDLVIMEVIMPGMDGIEATRELRRRFPQVRVLALTSFNDDDLVQRAFQAGAIGYLLKGTKGSELVEAIRTAIAGAPVLSPDATRALLSARNTLPAPDGDLSEREVEVLRLMGRPE
jgi:NarL family two-component system response regulator LiaR